MFDWFQMGGAGMYLILLVAMVAVPAAVAHAILARPVTLAISGPLLVLAVCLGGVFNWWGRTRVEEAVASVNPHDKEQIQQVGYAEAATNVKFGGGVFAAGILPLLIGEARRSTRKSNAPAPS